MHIAGLPEPKPSDLNEIIKGVVRSVTPIQSVHDGTAMSCNLCSKAAPHLLVEDQATCSTKRLLIPQLLEGALGKRKPALATRRLTKWKAMKDLFVLNLCAWLAYSAALFLLLWVVDECRNSPLVRLLGRRVEPGDPNTQFMPGLDVIVPLVSPKLVLKNSAAPSKL
jgi:hypothetical protein